MRVFMFMFVGFMCEVGSFVLRQDGDVDRDLYEKQHVFFHLVIFCVSLDLWCIIIFLFKI